MTEERKYTFYRLARETRSTSRDDCSSYALEYSVSLWPNWMTHTDRLIFCRLGYAREYANL